MIRLEPLGLGDGFEFEDKIVGGSVPKEFIPAVRKGIQDAMASGVIAGYPMVDIKATLMDGSFHEVDSSEKAFRVAATQAFRDGSLRAAPQLLQPFMSVEVVTPREHLGSITGDLNARKAIIEDVADVASGKVVRALVPLIQMFGYVSSLRSQTQGRATYSMKFNSYLPVSLREAGVTFRMAS